MLRTNILIPFDCLSFPFPNILSLRFASLLPFFYCVRHAFVVVVQFSCCCSCDSSTAHTDEGFHEHILTHAWSYDTIVAAPTEKARDALAIHIHIHTHIRQAMTWAFILSICCIIFGGVRSLFFHSICTAIYVMCVCARGLYLPLILLLHRAAAAAMAA